MHNFLIDLPRTFVVASYPNSSDLQLLDVKEVSRETTFSFSPISMRFADLPDQTRPDVCKSLELTARSFENHEFPFG